MEQTPPQLVKTKRYKRPSTALRHKQVLDNLVENGGSMRKAIQDAGYSEAVANNPQKITESVTWNEVMDKYFSDDELAQKHKELLNQKRIDYFVFSKKMEDEEITAHVEAAGLAVITIRESDKGKLAFYSIPDAQAKKAALEMAYKMKGRYTDETTVRPPTGNVYNFIFSAESQTKIRAMESEIKKALISKPHVQETA